MDDGQIADIWYLFREYIDKKSAHLLAAKFVDLLADQGTQDEEFKEMLGIDTLLDDAICEYLDIEDEEEYEEEYED